MDQSVSFVEEIDFQEIQLLEVVGKGSFGVVRKGIWRERNVAVKMIETEAEKKAFIVEVRQLSRVTHPNIVKLYGACTGSDVCLVMEYAEGGSLYNVLHGDPQPEYTAGHAIHWALQCAIGVAYLHGMKPKALIHRDLKPPNLLLVAGGTVLKICDFGTACDARTHMTNSKGSAAWMAPEVFEGQVYSETCDVFSWGIILWEVITRRKPFDEIGGPAFRIMWAVHKGQRPPLVRGCPRLLEMLMTGCWEKDPRRRPTMDEVVRIMSNEFQYFQGWKEPIKYPPQAESDSYTLDTLSATSTDTGNPVTPPCDPVTVSDEGNTIEDALKFPSKMNASGNLNADTATINQKRHSVDLSQLTSHEFAKQNHGHQRTRSDGSSFVPLDRELSIDSGVGQSGDGGAAAKMPSTKAASIQALCPLERPTELPHIGNAMERPSALFSMAHDSPLQVHVIENAFRVLEPRFQPIQPCLRSPESVLIYEEHKKLAHEYLLMKTELTNLNQRINRSSKFQDGNQLGNFGQVNSKLIDELVELQSERVSLEKLHESLKQQLAISRAQQRKNYPPRGRGKQR